MIAALERGLAFIDALDRTERSAFLGLFAGARFPWTIYSDGRGPFISKAECEWVEDWPDFYAVRLPAAGLFSWRPVETGMALGMVRKADGSYHSWTRIDCGPTALGREVREAWWDRHRQAVADTTERLPDPRDDLKSALQASEARVKVLLEELAELRAKGGSQ